MKLKVLFDCPACGTEVAATELYTFAGVVAADAYMDAIEVTTALVAECPNCERIVVELTTRTNTSKNVADWISHIEIDGNGNARGVN